MANVIMSVLNLLLGSLWIWCAVMDFKKERWGVFAFDVMLAIYQATFMVYYIIKGLIS